MCVESPAGTLDVLRHHKISWIGLGRGCSRGADSDAGAIGLRAGAAQSDQLDSKPHQGLASLMRFCLPMDLSTNAFI